MMQHLYGLTQIISFSFMNKMKVLLMLNILFRFNMNKLKFLVRSYKKKLTIMLDLTNEWILLKIQFECLTFVFIGNISKKDLFHFSFHNNCFLQEKVSRMHYFKLSVNKISKKERSSSVIKLKILSNYVCLGKHDTMASWFEFG